MPRAAADRNEQTIGDFYARCRMPRRSTAAANKPLRTELARIAENQSVADLQAEAERLHGRGVARSFLRIRIGGNESTRVSEAVSRRTFGVARSANLPEEEDKRSSRRPKPSSREDVRMLGDPADKVGAKRHHFEGRKLWQALDENTSTCATDQAVITDDGWGTKALTPNFSWKRIQAANIRH